MSGWPTRVLIAAESGGGGLTHDLDLARGLRARGIDVVLAAPGPEPTALERAAAEALGVRLEHAPLSLEWLGDGWRDGAAVSAWLADLEGRHRCDLVHLDGVSLAPGRFASSKIVSVRACALSWWEAVRGEPAPPEWGCQPDRRERGASLLAAHVVSPTRWSAPDDRASLHGAPARSSVIHDARAPGSFEPTGKQPFVLATGRVWDEAKNLPSLARAGRSLPWPVKIAGSIALRGRRRRREPRCLRGRRLLGAPSPPPTSPISTRARPSSRPRPAMTPRGSRCSRRRCRAAPSCSATSPACASCGTTPPCSFP